MRNDTSAQEILEIWDWDNGLPTGKPIPRGAAHQNGTPHEAVHLWIVRNTRRIPEILFQHRAPHKKIYPDCLDITVGGHVPYGFRGNKIAKEAYEEIGIDPNMKKIVDLGWCRYEEKNSDFFQREFLHVYILLDNRELNQYCFKDGEVTGIYAVPIADIKSIMLSDESFNIYGFTADGLVQKTMTKKNFHPQLFDVSMDAYMKVVMKAAEELTMSGHVTTKMSLV